MSETATPSPRSSRKTEPPPAELVTVTVPTPDGPVAYPDLGARLQDHLSRGGRIVNPWAATRDAGMTLLTRSHLAAVEIWVHPDGTIGYALLARLTRGERNSTVPRAEYIGAARVDTVATVAEG